MISLSRLLVRVRCVSLDRESRSICSSQESGRRLVNAEPNTVQAKKRLLCGSAKLRLKPPRFSDMDSEAALMPIDLGEAELEAGGRKFDERLIQAGFRLGAVLKQLVN